VARACLCRLGLLMAARIMRVDKRSGGDMGGGGAFLRGDKGLRCGFVWYAVMTQFFFFFSSVVYVLCTSFGRYVFFSTASCAAFFFFFSRLLFLTCMVRLASNSLFIFSFSPPPPLLIPCSLIILSPIRVLIPVIFFTYPYPLFYLNVIFSQLPFVYCFYKALPFGQVLDNRHSGRTRQRSNSTDLSQSRLTGLS